jgi:predicted PurR-regulated permease PerM
MYFQGGINTIVDLLTVVTSALLSLSLLGLLVYYLYRRWEKKNDLAD